jgi:hypothetical protein
VLRLNNSVLAHYYLKIHNFSPIFLFFFAIHPSSSKKSRAE